MRGNNSFHFEFRYVKAHIEGRYALTLALVGVLIFGAGVMYFGGSQALGVMFPARPVEAVKGAPP